MQLIARIYLRWSYLGQLADVGLAALGSPLGQVKAVVLDVADLLVGVDKVEDHGVLLITLPLPVPLVPEVALVVVSLTPSPTVFQTPNPKLGLWLGHSSITRLDLVGDLAVLPLEADFVQQNGGCGLLGRGNFRRPFFRHRRLVGDGFRTVLVTFGGTMGQV